MTRNKLSYHGNLHKMNYYIAADSGNFHKDFNSLQKIYIGEDRDGKYISSNDFEYLEFTPVYYKMYKFKKERIK